MQIIVNGSPHEVPDRCSIAELLVELKFPARFLAVERNLEVVPRQQHAETQLQPGDRLEIVTLVGGG